MPQVSCLETQVTAKPTLGLFPPVAVVLRAGAVPCKYLTSGRSYCIDGTVTGISFETVAVRGGAQNAWCASWSSEIQRGRCSAALTEGFMVQPRRLC